MWEFFLNICGLAASNLRNLDRFGIRKPHDSVSTTFCATSTYYVRLVWISSNYFIFYCHPSTVFNWQQDCFVKGWLLLNMENVVTSVLQGCLFLISLTIFLQCHLGGMVTMSRTTRKLWGIYQVRNGKLEESCSCKLLCSCSDHCRSAGHK